MLKHGAWMVRLLDKALDQVVSVITQSDDYKRCIELKEKMKNNKELMQIIDELKDAQKKYVKDGFKNKEEIESLEQKLYQIPIYVIYMEHLDRVNEMIAYVEEDLNDYFYQLLN